MKTLNHTGIKHKIMSKPTGNWGWTEDVNEYQLDIDNDNWTGFIGVVKEETDDRWWAMHANYAIAGGFETPEKAQLAAEEYCRENNYPFNVVSA
jgi:hypothetical protein